MEFPIEIVQLIHEYSKPATRYDWKTCRGMKQFDLIHEFGKCYYKENGESNEFINMNTVFTHRRYINMIQGYKYSK